MGQRALGSAKQSSYLNFEVTPAAQFGNSSCPIRGKMPISEFVMRLALPRKYRRRFLRAVRVPAVAQWG
eukprot:834422-Rhodomonas_salina.1